MDTSLVLRTLPDRPGVYQFYDQEGKLLYVGKAKNLKKRVSSYFNREHFGGKLNMLVRKTAEIRHIVVGSEFDALLLENNMIKEHQPRYNVMLKDDKTYPWICIKNEPFPRVFPTRTIVKDGSLYFGPYASVKMMNTLLELIRQIYPLRTCSLKLTKQNIDAGKFSVCLEFHLGNCLGPCAGLQAEENYMAAFAGIREMIKGNFSGVLKELRARMESHAQAYEFEKAQAVKEKISLLERYQAKSTIVNPKLGEMDVFSIADGEEEAYVNYMKVANGAVIQAHTVELKKKLDESLEELLAYVVFNLRTRLASEAREILVPFELDLELPGVILTVPKIGDKKHLLLLSEKNAKYYKLEKEKQLDLVDPERKVNRIMATMMKDLRMKEPPVHIECFDNSNFQGDQAVSAMVCFRNGKPDKKEYRHFNVRTVAGPDDFATMEEVIMRRYKRLVEEAKPLPQLIVVDGGKGQLSAALKSLEELGLRGKITIIGIAKKLEEIYYPDDPLPMYIDKKSETLKILQRLRDEAHRFGITHHRKKREKATLKTELTEIRGIGEETAKKLLSDFKSVKNIKNAPVEELEKSVGKAKAGVVFMYYHS
ncbi:MAG TPA: excinuclease ABC subunit UvrC [Bacteroidales bacterium]|nr:excinuclease ABC subunit UvrC [Bacteroidales bacterium]HPI87614.1 excinuclease ABC subunit UvrC [Bacteroidales bacterium]